MPKKIIDYTFKGKKPDHISASQINTGACLYKYLRLRLRQDISDTNESMTIGHFMHKVIYEYTAYCMKAKDEGDFQEMDKIFDE